MKHLRNSLTVAFALLTGFALTSNAQITSQKIGNNPTTKTPGALLELESTDKGLLLPRISLNNTASWGLAGTQVKGMAVFNINTSITGSTTYPVAGGDRTGIYFWDGTGWLATASTAGNDPTKDAWIDDPTNTRVQLGTLSDGSTARPLGTEVVVKDDGKVGIGTLNPVWSLDVQGTSAIGHFKRFTGSSIFNVAPSLLFTRSRGTATAELDVSAGDFLGKVQFRGRTAGVDEDYGVMAYIANSTTPGDGRFGFFNLHGDVNSIEVISINTKTGNLGVGSTSPTSRLYLSGYARLGSTDATADGLATPADRTGMIRYNSTLKAFQYHDNTQWVTTDPSTDSWVDDNTNTQVKVGTLSDGVTARPAGTEVVIKNDGKVGIGTTAPSAQLHVKPTSTSTSGLRVENMSDSRSRQDANVNYDLGNSSLAIDGNGNVYKKYNPVASNSSASSFDGNYSAGSGAGAAVNIVSLNNGSIVRFQLYVSGLVLGTAGTGANLYADISYGYGGGGFRVATYASEAGGTATNLVTPVLSNNGHTLTFDFATGDDLVITNTSNTDAGPLAIYHTGTNVATVLVDIFSSFRSR